VLPGSDFQVAQRPLVVNDPLHNAAVEHQADFGNILDRCLKIDELAFLLLTFPDLLTVVIQDLVVQRQAGMVEITYGSRGVQNGDDLPGDMAVGRPGNIQDTGCRLRSAPTTGSPSPSPGSYPGWRRLPSK